MGRLKICPVCKGYHRKLSAAKRCYRRHHQAKWDLAQLRSGARR